MGIPQAVARAIECGRVHWAGVTLVHSFNKIAALFLKERLLLFAVPQAGAHHRSILKQTGY